MFKCLFGHKYKIVSSDSNFLTVTYILYKCENCGHLQSESLVGKWTHRELTQGNKKE